MEKIHLFILLFCLFILVILITLGYGKYIGSQRLSIKKYIIKDQDLPISFQDTKIVHFTDLHYGHFMSKQQVQHLVDTINQQHPDIIVFTGDLVNNSDYITDEDIQTLSDLFSQLKSTYGTYAILGNHDFGKKGNEEKVIEIFRRSNIYFLRNSYKIIQNETKEQWIIAGLDDFHFGKPDVSSTLEFNTKNNYFTVVLTHEPDSMDEIANEHVNIVLAGHSHGGQIRLPWIGHLVTTDLAKKYTKDYHIVNNIPLYVSYGIGTTILPLRYFNRPSISVYTLRKED